MSDISQHGLIGTFQRLRENPQLADDLAQLTREQPTALILPCHASELKRPALRGILRELSAASYLAEVIIPINGTDREGIAAARCFFKASLALPHRILWCDPIHGESVPAGKGSNVWSAIGLLAREQRVAVVLLADADVTTFRLKMLSRLLFPLVAPSSGYTFAKSYYPRVTEERIHGRVSRLFLAPLLQAVVRTAGHLPLLDFLRSFRYPLAGECALRLDLAAELPLDPGWGLEIGMLCDIFRQVDPRQVCQVDAGLRYDHKHQPLGDDGGGLVRMAGEIAATLLQHLQQEGIRLTPAFLDAVVASYRRESAEALRRSTLLARINALRYAVEEERHAVDSFCGILQSVCQEGSQLANRESMRAPLPPWSQPTTLSASVLARLEVF